MRPTVGQELRRAVRGVAGIVHTMYYIGCAFNECTDRLQPVHWEPIS